MGRYPRLGDTVQYIGESLCVIALGLLIYAFKLIGGILDFGERGAGVGRGIALISIAMILIGGLLIAGGFGYTKGIAWASRLGSVAFVGLAGLFVYWLVLFVPYSSRNASGEFGSVVGSLAAVLGLIAATYGSLWSTMELWRAA